MSRFLPASLAAMLATLVVASPAVAAPAITVTPEEAVDPTGQTLTVQGTGFNPIGVGIYVAFGPKRADFSTNADPYLEAKWVRPNGPDGSRLETDGSFSVTVAADAKYEAGDGEDINCFTEPGGCKVITMAAHGSPDRSQDTEAAVLFSPLLTVTPTDALATGTDVEVTVTGEGYRYTAGPPKGVYLAFGPKRSDFNTNVGNYYASKWVRPFATASAAGAPLDADGSFTTTLTVRSAYTDTNTTPNAVDCRVEECSVLTFSDHNAPADRSQDAVVPVSFKAPAQQPTDQTPAGTNTPPVQQPPAQNTNPPVQNGNPPAGPLAAALRVSDVRLSRRRVSFQASGAGTFEIGLYRPRMRNGTLRWRLVRTLTLRALRAGRIGTRHRLRKAGPVRIVIRLVDDAGRETQLRASLGTVPRKRR